MLSALKGAGYIVIEVYLIVRTFHMDMEKL